MSTEPLHPHPVAGTADSERGLLLAMLVMVVLGVLGMLALSA